MSGADVSRGDKPPPEHVAASTVALIISAAVFLYLIRLILLPFVLPLIVAYVLEPLVRRISGALRLRRPIVATGMLVVVLALIALLVSLIFPVFAHEIRNLSSNLQGTVEAAANNVLQGREVQLFGRSLNAAQLTQLLMETLQRAVADDARLITLVTTGVGALVGVVLSAVLLAYFLIDGPRIARGALTLVPPRYRPFVSRVSLKLDPILRRYFIGVAAVVVYASVAAYIGLGLILGVRHAVVLAIVTGILELIPLVGPALSALIVGLLATQEAKSAWDIAAFVIYAFALRISIDQLFGPLVLGKAASVSPVVIIFCFLAGGLLLGIVGVILAVPAALLIRTALLVLYDEPRNR